MDRTGIIVVTICVLIMGVWLYDEQKYQHELALHPPAPVAAAAPAAAPNAQAPPKAPKQSASHTAGGRRRTA